MSVNKLMKVTAYSGHISQCVHDWAVGELGWMTVKQIADCCGLQPTHNLRKRLNYLVELKILARAQWHDDNGHWYFVYLPADEYRNVARQTSIPF